VGIEIGGVARRRQRRGGKVGLLLLLLLLRVVVVSVTIVINVIAFASSVAMKGESIGRSVGGAT